MLCGATLGSFCRTLQHLVPQASLALAIRSLHWEEKTPVRYSATHKIVLYLVLYHLTVTTTLTRTAHTASRSHCTTLAKDIALPPHTPVTTQSSTASLPSNPYLTLGTTKRNHHPWTAHTNSRHHSTLRPPCTCPLGHSKVTRWSSKTR